MCRNIKTLFNFDPPVTDDEVQAASLQFVRKITGFNKPSKSNEAAFLAAVDEVAGISKRLLRSLETTAPPKNREEEAAKAKLRAAQRFGIQYMPAASGLCKGQSRIKFLTYSLQGIQQLRRIQHHLQRASSPNAYTPAR